MDPGRALTTHANRMPCPTIEVRSVDLGLRFRDEYPLGRCAFLNPPCQVVLAIGRVGQSARHDLREVPEDLGSDLRIALSQSSQVLGVETKESYIAKGLDVSGSLPVVEADFADDVSSTRLRELHVAAVRSLERNLQLTVDDHVQRIPGVTSCSPG